MTVPGLLSFRAAADGHVQATETMLLIDRSTASMNINGPTRLDEIWRKNREELMAILRGPMPAHLLGPHPRWSRPPRRPPVLVFHDIEPGRFEIQLRYPAASGYRGVDAAELDDLLASGEHDPRAIALTFDDADCTFWSYGFPLLRRHGFKSILFVIPGLVAHDHRPARRP